LVIVPEGTHDCFYSLHHDDYLKRLTTSLSLPPLPPSFQKLNDFFTMNQTSLNDSAASQSSPWMIAAAAAADGL
jgi:hypothetical protein